MHHMTAKQIADILTSGSAKERAALIAKALEPLVTSVLATGCTTQEATRIAIAVEAAVHAFKRDIAIAHERGCALSDAPWIATAMGNNAAMLIGFSDD